MATKAPTAAASVGAATPKKMLPSTDRTSTTTGTTEVKSSRIFLMDGGQSAILFTVCYVLENRRLTARSHLLIRSMIEKEEVLKFYAMNDSSNSAIENVLPSFVKTRLADLLTLSRGLIGLVILSLSFIGEDAYITVVILALTGAATDIFDGRAARRYLGENREGKLGKFDLEIDTLFVLCIIGYFSALAYHKFPPQSRNYIPHTWSEVSFPLSLPRN